MNVIVLTLHDLRDYPLSTWATGEEHRFFVIADAETQKLPASEFKDYASVEYFDNYINNGLVEKRVMEIAETHGVDHIAVFGEDDVIRAGRLRERLGLPGQDMASATAFRCKVTMKDCLRSSGVRLPHYQRLFSPLDLIDFVETHGLPVFVKPTTSSGSVWARKLSTLSEMDAFLSSGFKARVPFSEYVSDMMVESFVEGNLHHVDGYWDGHSIQIAVASRYLSPSLDLGLLSQETALMSVSLSEDSELSRFLVRETKLALEHLPSKSGFPFHAEFFVNGSEITFCEIAARTGGARVATSVEHATGYNLNHLSFLSQIGIASDLSAKRFQFSGWSMLCPPSISVLKDPSTCPYEWVVEYKTDAKQGDKTDHRHYSGDKIASAVVVGRDEQEVADRLNEFNHWFLKSFTDFAGAHLE